MRRILLAYEGSPPARRALNSAIAEARDSNGRITVLSVERLVLDPSVPRNFGTLDDIADWEGAEGSAPPDVAEHLEEARELLSAAGIEAELTWAAGEPGQEIAEAAQRIGADVIVLGEHHHGHLSSFFGSNVDEEVQRAAGCEVVFRLTRAARPRGHATLRGLAGMIRPDRIAWRAGAGTQIRFRVSRLVG